MQNGTSHLEKLRPYLREGVAIEEIRGIPSVEIASPDEALAANAYYFGQKEWMKDWLAFVHRYPEFRERWEAVVGSLDGKIVVDIGCGPGNVLASLGVRPAMAIGVDVARGSLEMAAKVGYIPLLADAHHLPLKSGIADIVMLNATLHHCVDMDRVLLECARLVKTGGTLVLDHDPQVSAWDYRGLGMVMWKMRKPLYRWMNRGGHRAEGNQQEWAERTEIHHRPGDGITEAMVREPLETAGFAVSVWPHNHAVGADILEGKMGRAKAKLRWGQRVSGIDPNSKEGALSLMVRAVKMDESSL